MYIHILDYTNGRVIIELVSDEIDAEDYIESILGISLSNINYMTTKELDIQMLTVKY
jgi:hypothetical protein